MDDNQDPKTPKRTNKGTWAKGSSGNATGKPKLNLDGWSSAITGIGNAFLDKRTTHTFCPVVLAYEKCVEIYESDDLGRRAAGGPVDDLFRPGYEISITDEGDFADLKEDIENRLRELEVDRVVRKALTQKRALGGAAILIGVRDNKPMDQPLDRSAAANIEFLTNLEPMDLNPYKYYDNPIAPKFGEVEIWELRASMLPIAINNQVVKVAATEVQNRKNLIHESRLIVFNQDKVSRYTTTFNPAGQYWGLSIYVQIYEILRDFNIAWSAAGLLVTDFSQAVFSIDNLMHLVMRDEEGLIKRMQAMNMGRSVARAILVDTKEKFTRESINLAGLPDLMTQLSKRFGASIDTPLSVLMGGGDKTDGADPDGELRYYYDKLSSMQRDEVGPVIRLFAEMIMRGLRQRKLPKKWSIKWHPLWQLTDEQKANARLAQARVDAIYVQHGVLDPDTVAKLRFGGEYSFDTAVPTDYEAPGFMALPPLGVVVDGMDPKTGLPPGVPPPPAGSNAGGAGAHGVSSYARRNPRQTSHAGTDLTAGGAVASAKADESEHCGGHEAGQTCGHCLTCDECFMAPK